MNAVLGLEDGTFIKGTGFGAEGIVSGELVFTTQYTGYEEALTDPSYKGQILMFTYPLIGNYGVSGNCFESGGVKAEGLVVREACPEPSHHISKKTIFELMEDEGKPGIAGVDTRMLTIKTREHGTMRAALINGSDDGEEAVRLARAQKSISDIDLISQVTCPQPFRLESPCRDKNNPLNVVLVDCGRKLSIERSLLARGMDVTVVPGNASVPMIESYEPDLLFFSNGPGDPLRAQDAISAVKHFAGELPIVGICLGHQIISLALGAETYKLKFGHRGANQPVKDLESGIVHITSQNHGFAVDGDSFEQAEVEVTQFNTNDRTVEGISHKYLDIFSVQYHPDAHPGPMDTEKIFFEKVLKLAGGKK
ncbi:MAG: glutamine-hydrolyzing carbamoyl-phosphate synthase small subunit [Methanolobus sp.]|nr:glutamine-hydrolyzing carbamoyl-phosphate synthase small subunit [Methanolobus sp.]